MKRYVLRRARQRRKQRMTVLSWALLAFSWMLALPVAFLIIRDARAELTQPEPTAAASAAPVFAAEKQEPQLTLEMQTLPAPKTLRGEQPTVLIYHTHTTEAYFPTAQNPYVKTSDWRTADNTKNVVAVGEALKTILETQYGFSVVHDTTDHEPPKLATSYDRSLVTMQKYHEQYPSIVLFIDLHRDAYADATQPADYLTLNGTETARLMFVVGKGEKYAEKPLFETNYALAERITEHLQSIDPKLARPIREKTGRYNQHVSPNCLLVEVGHNANTLEQALAAMPYLAEGIAYAFPIPNERLNWTPN